MKSCNQKSPITETFLAAESKGGHNSVARTSKLRYIDQGCTDSLYSISWPNWRTCAILSFIIHPLGYS